MSSGSSTKDLKQTLTRLDLFGIAVGQIIGAGIMVMSISALQMTGRSVNLAFMVAAVLTVIAAVPIIFYSSCIRVRGGFYTTAGLFVHPIFSGIYIVTYVFSNMSIAMYAIGFVSYMARLVPWFSSTKTITNLSVAAVMTIFFILNFFGTEYMAKIQNVMFYLLIIALLVFLVFGLPKVQWGGYFGNELFGQPLFTGDIMDFLSAAAYLTFATGGATVIVNFSAECVNPKADIPIVTIISTVGVAAIYAGIATVIGGVMPPEEVIAAGNLAPIAKLIMPAPLYYFFIIAGAGFALGTTLNATIGWVTKPLLQACEDGWFPRFLGKLHPKYKSPWVLLILFWTVNLFPIFFGLNIGQLGSMVLLIGNAVAAVQTFAIIRLPKMFPEQWAASPFKIPTGVLTVLLTFAAAVGLFQAYLQARNLTATLLYINAGIFVIAIIYAFTMYKTGAVKMTQSYDLA